METCGFISCGDQERMTVCETEIDARTLHQQEKCDGSVSALEEVGAIKGKFSAVCMDTEVCAARCINPVLLLYIS